MKAIKLSTDSHGRFVAHLYHQGRWDKSPQLSDYGSREFIQSVPERVRLTHATYQFAVTDCTTSAITSFYDRQEIEFEDELTEMAFKVTQLRLKSLEANALTNADFKENGTIPDHSLTLHEKYPLAGYQVVGAVNAMRTDGFALFMEQGTGKTPIVITRVCNECDNVDHVYRVLIACPKNVRMNWEREFKKFATEKGKVTVLRGGELDRVKGLIQALSCTNGEKFTVVICGYDTIVRSWDALKKIKFDLGVLDESHFIKSPSTKRTKHVLKLRDTCKARMVLTGTPVPNNYYDAWTQLEFLGEGASGFANFKSFKNFYGVFCTQGDSSARLVGCQNLPHLKERLARISFVVRKNEVLAGLPDKTYDAVEVEMVPDQLACYKKLRDELIIEIEEELSRSDNAIVINNALTKMLRLAQVTSGFITYPAEYTDDGDLIHKKKIKRFESNPKIDELVELLSEKGPNDKTIVWAVWRPDLKIICDTLKAKGIGYGLYYGGSSDKQREHAEWRFNNDPKCKVFVGNPDAGGTGLNLLGYPPESPEIPTNANHVIYFSQNWRDRSQSEDRAHRRGTRESVRVTDLVMPGTIDQVIRERVIDKRIAAYNFQDLKSILQSVLHESLQSGTI